MLKPGTIVCLTKKGAKEVMRRWPKAHPFYELAKFLVKHPDGRILIREHGYSDHYDITVTPETFMKYKKILRHMSVYLCNWEEPWFKVEGQISLPEPKYSVDEEVFVKDIYNKYRRVTVEKIVATWKGLPWKGEPCSFDSWTYQVLGLDGFHYPFSESKVVACLKHQNKREPSGNTKDWKEMFSVA